MSENEIDLDCPVCDSHVYDSDPNVCIKCGLDRREMPTVENEEDQYINNSGPSISVSATIVRITGILAIVLGAIVAMISMKYQPLIAVYSLFGGIVTGAMLILLSNISVSLDKIEWNTRDK